MAPNKKTSKHALRLYFWWGNWWTFWGLELMTQSDPMDVKWPFIVAVFQHRFDGFLQRCEVNLLRLQKIKLWIKGTSILGRKVEQETCLFMVLLEVSSFFLDKKTHVGNAWSKKTSGEPKRAFSARCKLNFSHVSSTSACCAATKAANGDKSWEYCCCLLLRSWLLTSSNDFCGRSGWNWDVSSWSRTERK